MSKREKGLSEQFRGMLRNVATVGSSELEMHIVKATFYDDEIPKPKHINAVLRTIEGNRHACKQTLSVLRRRIDKALQAKSQWQVMIKCLLVVHKGIQYRQDAVFIEEMSSTGIQFLNIDSYLDRASETSWGNSKYCRNYAAFLSERALGYRDTNGISFQLPSEQLRKKMKKLKPAKLYKLYTSLVSQMRALVECRAFEDQGGYHVLAKYSLILLAKDAFSLSTILNLAIYSLMDHLVSLGVRQTEAFLEATEQYNDLLPDLTKFHASVASLKRRDLKDLIPTEKERKKNRSWIRKVKDCLETHLDESKDSSKKPKSRTARADSIESVETYSLNDFLGEDTTKKTQKKQQAVAASKLFDDDWDNFDSAFPNTEAKAKVTGLAPVEQKAPPQNSGYDDLFSLIGHDTTTTAPRKNPGNFSKTPPASGFGNMTINPPPASSSSFQPFSAPTQRPTPAPAPQPQSRDAPPGTNANLLFAAPPRATRSRRGSRSVSSAHSHETSSSGAFGASQPQQQPGTSQQSSNKQSSQTFLLDELFS